MKATHYFSSLIKFVHIQISFLFCFGFFKLYTNPSESNRVFTCIAVIALASSLFSLLIVPVKLIYCSKHHCCTL